MAKKKSSIRRQVKEIHGAVDRLGRGKNETNNRKKLAKQQVVRATSKRKK